LGFSTLDAKVYVYIAKLGPLSNKEIASHLGIESEQLNPVLRRLTDKGVITSTSRNQEVYSALSFEDLLNEFIKMEINQAEDIKKNHQQLISTWKSVTRIEDAQQ
jgi:sugar-specific transcriptional regulator TrmB